MTTTAVPGRSAPARTGVAVGPIAVRWRPRVVILATLLVVIMIAVVVQSLVFGRLDYPLSLVWEVLRGGGTRVERLVIVDQRLTRSLAAVLVGACLGIAGALTQSITRNPIASPDILGVTNGAAAVAVVLVTNPALVTALGLGSMATGLSLAGLVGGLVTTGLILALSARGGFDGTRLILVGLGVNAVAVAVVSWQLTRATDIEAATAIRWLAGSLIRVDADQLLVVTAILAVGVVASAVLSRGLDGIRLGREIASGLGVTPARVEAGALALAVVLTSSATALAGPVPFVAFVAAQGALRLFRTAGPPPVLAGLSGAALLLVADWGSQRLPVDVPIGVVTSVIGAPVLLILLSRRLRRTS